MHDARAVTMLAGDQVTLRNLVIAMIAGMGAAFLLGTTCLGRGVFGPDLSRPNADVAPQRETTLTAASLRAVPQPLADDPTRAMVPSTPPAATADLDAAAEAPAAWRWDAGPPP